MGWKIIAHNGIVKFMQFPETKEAGKGGGRGGSQQLWWEILSALCLSSSPIFSLLTSPNKQTIPSLSNESGQFEVTQCVRAFPRPLTPLLECLSEHLGQQQYRSPIFPVCTYFQSLCFAMFEGMSALIYLLLLGATAIWAGGAAQLKANINMETFMLTGFKFESPQPYWIRG